MAKKKQFVNEDFTMAGVPDNTAEKMPFNVTGGKRLLKDYLEIPTNQLIPFRNKNGRDFKRTDQALLEQMKASMRDDGVVDALTVRPIGEDQYEILEGETRWMMAQEIGLEYVPCHIIDADDNKASRIFTITNLLRRTLLPSDRINGWTLYHEAEKKAGRLSELRKTIDELDSLNMTGREAPIAYRTIMVYVQMSHLIQEWLDRLDAKEVSFKAAREISRLPEDKQRQLLPYNVSEDEAHLLVDIAKGKNEKISWSEDILAKTLIPLIPATTSTEEPAPDHSDSDKGQADAPPDFSEQAPAPITSDLPVPPSQEEAPGEGEEEADGQTEKQTDGENPQSIDQEKQFQQEKRFRKARTSIIKGAGQVLRPNDYENAESIIVKALTIYYEMLDNGKIK